MSNDWIEAVEDEPAATKVLVTVPKREMSIQEVQNERLHQMENEMLEECLEVVHSVAEFAEVDPDSLEEVPADLIASVGLKAAEKIHRLRKYGLMSAKEAPVGIKIAAQMATGIMRARATEKGGNKSLNINVVQFAVPVPDQYEEVEVDNE